MDWLIAALLVFLVVLGLAIALVASKPPRSSATRILACIAGQS